MDLLTFLGGMIVGGIIGSFITALFVVRESRKDEMFYKDCIRNLRNQLIEKEKDNEDTRTYPGSY